MNSIGLLDPSTTVPEDIDSGPSDIPHTFNDSLSRKCALDSFDLSSAAGDDERLILHGQSCASSIVSIEMVIISFFKINFDPFDIESIFCNPSCR